MIGRRVVHDNDVNHVTAGIVVGYDELTQELTIRPVGDFTWALRNAAKDLGGGWDGSVLRCPIESLRHTSLRITEDDDG